MTDRIAAARRGGQISIARRRERAAAVEAFRQELKERIGAADDQIKNALADCATALYAGIVPHATVSVRVRRPLKGSNLLSISAATSSLRNMLRELGVLEIVPDPDAPPPADAPLEVRQEWSRRYVDRVLAESPVPHELETK